MDNTDDFSLHTLLGAKTRFDGKLAFDGAARIDGHFSGHILSEGTLVVGEDAKLSGHVRARKIIVQGGEVEADMTATVSIEVYVPAKVRGNLKAPSIFLDKSVEFRGQCSIEEVNNMELDEKPAEPQLVAVPHGST